MTSCHAHDVKNHAVLLISVCRIDRKVIIFLFLWLFGLLSSKMLLFLFLHDVITSWRNAMTSQNSLFLYQFVNVLNWWYRFISVNISVAEFQTIIVVFICMICFPVITWHHDVTEIILLRQETYFLHLSLQVCSRANSIFVSVISLVAELNFVIVIYLHYGRTSRNDVMTSLNMLYLSQLVEVLEIWFFFCFYSILGDWVQKYHRFYICICGYVISWRHDVTDMIIWRHKTH